MIRLFRWFLVLIILLTGGTALAASEKRIDRSELPVAVQKALEVEQRGATVRGCSQETNGKETLYEVELVANGRSKDILMDDRGRVVEVEEEIPVESLPVRVQQRLRAEVSGGRIDKLEATKKRGKLTSYEVHMVKDGVRSEIQLNSEGERQKRQQ